MESDNSEIRTENGIDIRIKLSGLWITLMLLYIYADILSLFSPGAVKEIIEGYMGPFPVSQTALLLAALLMVIPALMVILSLMLKPKANRLVNIIAGVFYTLISIGNIIGESWVYYILFGLIEACLTILIIRISLKWTISHPVR